jgi:cell fate regulator YaaT (PSP1 superfamily)
MAKNQNLSLNPNNISGICGKLLCCIHYEDDQYKELRKIMPKMDSFVGTPEGKGKVTNINFILKQITVRIKDAQHVFHLDEIQFKEKGEILLLRLANELLNVGIPDNINPKLEGKRMILYIRPKKNK